MATTARWPNAATLIPDLLFRAPESRAVLDRFGLNGCGGTAGPAESLGWFARAHDIPMESLLREVRAVVPVEASPVPPVSAMAQASLPILDNPQPRPEDAIYRPFFKAGIAVVLSLGAVWGAYLLIRIAAAGQFTAAGLHDINAHGHAQIFGWVGLFVMGFAYQAFPRFKHTSLAWPRLAFLSLGMMLAGVVIRSFAQPAAAWVTWAWWPAVGASVVEVAAVAVFATVILETWRRSGRGLAFYDWYILSSLGWFLAQAVSESIYLAATLNHEGEELISLVVTWQPALRDAQIHGFALLMILGVSQRIFHHFYGLPEPSRRLSRAAIVALNLAIIGEVTGLVLMRAAGHNWAALWYCSTLVLSASVVGLVWNWRIFSHTDEGDRSLKFLRAAYIWLLVSLAMLVGLPAYQHGLLPLLAPGSEALRIGFSHAFYGAIRHAITVGFVSLMIVGVASKVVPTLNGVSAIRLSQLWGPFVLINVGCSLRVLGQTSTDFTAAAFPVAGISGVLEVTGLALWGVHLWMVMSGRPRLRPASGEASPVLSEGMPIRGDHMVGQVLETSPELLEVFVEHGFTTLTNPQFRRTVARLVTIEKACRRLGVDQRAILLALNSRRAAAGRHASVSS